MKLNASSTLTLLLPLVALSLVPGLSSPSYAESTKAPAKDAKAAKTAAPDVVLPYTFVCPDCGMKITIKTPADWNKDCLTCACNKTNLGCYHDKKKDPKK